MKIKYTGPRPHISQHGVTFKEGKEDKYVYLTIALQILKAIDKDFSEQKSYSYDVSSKRLSDDEMVEFFKQYETTVEKDIDTELNSYQNKLDEEKDSVAMRQDLGEDEKKVWLENLSLMREYRLQRAVNKIFYIHTIKEIAKVIKREKINKLTTPFYEKFWHVLRSIHGELLSLKSPIGSELKIEERSSAMIAKLLISNY